MHVQMLLDGVALVSPSGAPVVSTRDATYEVENADGLALIARGQAVEVFIPLRRMLYKASAITITGGR